MDLMFVLDLHATLVEGLGHSAEEVIGKIAIEGEGWLRHFSLAKLLKDELHWLSNVLLATASIDEPYLQTGKGWVSADKDFKFVFNHGPSSRLLRSTSSSRRNVT